MQIQFLRTSVIICLVSLSQQLYSKENSSWWWPWSQTTSVEVKPEASYEVKPEASYPVFNFQNIQSLEDRLSKRVISQEEAVRALSDALLIYTAGIHDHTRPIGCFLFIGASGVGKTELAKALSKEIATDPEQFVHLNLSEFSSREVGLNRLIGSPWGYIDNDKGGELSNALLKNPYSVVLLDEFEKANADTRLLFLHIFDEGFFTSAKRERVDCTHCIFIATTNVGAEVVHSQFTKNVSGDAILEKIKPCLIKEFTPELYNRMDSIVFRNLDNQGLIEIIRLKLEEVSERIYTNSHLEIHFDDSIVEYIFNRCLQLQNGARSILGVIKKDIVSTLAKGLLERKIQADERVLMTYKDGCFQLIDSSAI